MNGVERIAAERARQVAKEGYDAEHDNEHEGGEIAGAAHSYVEAAVRQVAAAYCLEALPGAGGVLRGRDIPPSQKWRFTDGWKPSDDPLRNLEKAGALIAAEIDRLLRARATDDD